MFQEMNAVSAGKNLNGHYRKWTYTNGHKLWTRFLWTLYLLDHISIERNICGQSVLDEIYVDKINWTNSMWTKRCGRIVLEAKKLIYRIIIKDPRLYLSVECACFTILY